MAYARGDTGTPIVRVHYRDATPELVARTRENFERALSKLESERLGAQVEIKVEWPAYAAHKEKTNGRRPI